MILIIWLPSQHLSLFQETISMMILAMTSTTSVIRSTQNYWRHNKSRRVYMSNRTDISSDYCKTIERTESVTELMVSKNLQIVQLCSSDSIVNEFTSKQSTKQLGLGCNIGELWWESWWRHERGLNSDWSPTKLLITYDRTPTQRWPIRCVFEFDDRRITHVCEAFILSVKLLVRFRLCIVNFWLWKLQLSCVRLESMRVFIWKMRCVFGIFRDLQRVCEKIPKPIQRSSMKKWRTRDLM